MTSNTARAWTLAGALLVASSVGAAACVKPISEMGCRQLGETMTSIQADLEPGQPVEVQRDAVRRAEAVNLRVDQLGGCPGEPALD